MKDEIVGYVNIWSQFAVCKDCWTGPKTSPHYISTTQGTLIPPGGPIQKLSCTYCGTSLFDLAAQLNGIEIKGDCIVRVEDNSVGAVGDSPGTVRNRVQVFGVRKVLRELAQTIKKNAQARLRPDQARRAPQASRPTE